MEISLHGKTYQIKSWANLYGADLRGANLRGADLYGADLYGAKNVPPLVVARTCILPAGHIIGWKKVNLPYFGDGIVKLSIPEDADRSNATGRKCRASKAIVLEIQDLDGHAVTSDVVATSTHDPSFQYKVGETVIPTSPFDTDRWKECAPGIHFYITREEAVNH
jgi:hypothetical protein